MLWLSYQAYARMHFCLCYFMALGALDILIFTVYIGVSSYQTSIVEKSLIIQIYFWVVLSYSLIKIVVSCIAASVWRKQSRAEHSSTDSY